MPLVIPVAHDFTCPWCWAGLLQAKRLIAEEGVEIEWVGFELMPIELDWSAPRTPEAPPPPNRPRTLSRLEFLLEADGIDLPRVVRPPRMRTHQAHLAVEFAKERGNHFAFCEALYRAYWEDARNINEIDELKRIGAKEGLDPTELEVALLEDRYADRVVGFDDPAYRVGIYNVPTFTIGDERYAEQPYSVLQRAVRAVNGREVSAAPHQRVVLPASPPSRPYTLIDMVATIDGKILSGERDEPVNDLGSDVDHAAMRNLLGQVDGVLIGAGTLRSTSATWNPRTAFRVVVSESGNIDFGHAFFQGGSSFVATSKRSNFQAGNGVGLIRVGDEKLDWNALMQRLREMGIERLLVLGGSEINAQILKADLADELFLTVAPKVKLGKDVPTYAGGDPLPRAGLLPFELVENQAVGNELFLRYRRVR